MKRNGDPREGARRGEQLGWKAKLGMIFGSFRLWYSWPWMLRTEGGPWNSFLEWWLFLLQQLKQSGISLASDFFKAWDRGSGHTEDEAVAVRTEDRDTGWQPPAQNWIKINCDVGWTKETKSGALGVVARDDAGEFKGARCKQVDFVPSALVAEALAIREGMQFAWEKSCHQVEVESDAKVSVEIINGV
ncbi:hypothetical protein LIER_21540 [Lithospermum erythrorhizon]|uniref:RNase H type-1 domain-containing protein n=1 Tax=Lithospermum erythrorhizon TaxID=34254 RepID=A0AAV3QT11_LITER